MQAHHKQEFGRCVQVCVQSRGEGYGPKRDQFTDKPSPQVHEKRSSEKKLQSREETPESPKKKRSTRCRIRLMFVLSGQVFTPADKKTGHRAITVINNTVNISKKEVTF